MALPHSLETSTALADAFHEAGYEPPETPRETLERLMKEAIKRAPADPEKAFQWFDVALMREDNAADLLSELYLDWRYQARNKLRTKVHNEMRAEAAVLSPAPKGQGPSTKPQPQPESESEKVNGTLPKGPVIIVSPSPTTKPSYGMHVAAARQLLTFDTMIDGAPLRRTRVSVVLSWARIRGIQHRALQILRDCDPDSFVGDVITEDDLTKAIEEASLQNY